MKFSRSYRNEKKYYDELPVTVIMRLVQLLVLCVCVA